MKEKTGDKERGMAVNIPERERRRDRARRRERENTNRYNREERTYTRWGNREKRIYQRHKKREEKGRLIRIMTREERREKWEAKTHNIDRNRRERKEGTT